MKNDTLTHKDLAQKVGVSVTTIKSYRRKFPGFIPIAGYGKPIRFQQDALAVCLKINELFKTGLSVHETELRLREQFKESPRNRHSSSPIKPSSNSSFSNEALEKLADTSAQMMRGMAQLATAQAKSEVRLQKLEQKLQGLLEAEAGNKLLLGELANRYHPEISNASKVKAKKIVNIRTIDGHVDSYKLEDQERVGIQDDSADTEDQSPQTTETPSREFLSLPITVRSDKGEYLGMPNRMNVSGFSQLLEQIGADSGAVLLSWKRNHPGWILDIQLSDGTVQAIHIARTKTPKGNTVAIVHRLDEQDREMSQSRLMEFFREAKDRA